MHPPATTSQLPLVSVIIPAYNAEAFIRYTIASVIEQTYTNLEVIVVDDGSCDRTSEIVQELAQIDSRIKLLYQHNAGVAAARNLGINHSQGEYIAPIDADDIWFPEKLAKQVECIVQAGPQVGLVYSWSVDIDEDGFLIGGFHAHEYEGGVYPFLVYKNFLGHASAPLIRRTCIEKLGGYNVQLLAKNAQGCEDLELYLRIAAHYQFRVVKQFLIGYRRVIGSMSSNYKTMARSYLQVQSNVRVAHPEIPAHLYAFCDSNFYIYLARQSRLSGNHRSAIFWLYTALYHHPATLLHPTVYASLFSSLMKYLALPITSLIWPDHRAWIQFGKQLRFGFRQKTLADIDKWVFIYQKIYALSPWKLYEKFALSRLQALFWPQAIAIISTPKNLPSGLPYRTTV